MANRISAGNSTSTPLASGGTFVGAAEPVAGYQSITVLVVSDTDLTVHIDQSIDGTNWDVTSSASVEADVSRVTRAATVARYARVRLVNSASVQTTLRSMTLFHEDPVEGVTALDETVDPTAPALTTQSVIIAKNDLGSYQQIALGEENALKVQIQTPLSSFGEVLVTEPTPVAQVDFVAGRYNGALFRRISFGTATQYFNDSMVALNTGTVPYSYSYLATRRRVRYKPGQGTAARFTSVFDTPQADSTQVVGLIDGENALGFGYLNTAFGILHRRAGKSEIRRMMVEAAAGSSATIFLVLSGATFPVAVTNAGGVLSTTAEQIAQTPGLEAGFWRAQSYATDTTAWVEFMSIDAAPKVGTFSLSTVSTTWETIRTGSVASDTWIPQTSWNVDKMDGAGPSGQLLDKQKGNVYQIDYQYLGFGQLRFMVEDASDGEIHLVHRIQYGNANLVPSLDAPVMPLAGAIGSTGSTVPMSMKIGSMSAFTQGRVARLGPRRGKETVQLSVGTTAVPILAIRNPYTYQGKRNTAEILLTSLSVGAEGTRPALFTLVTNGVLTNPSWRIIDANSVANFDESATALTGGTQQHAGTVAKSSNILLGLDELNLLIPPGDFITLLARAVTGTADISAAISWVEE